MNKPSLVVGTDDDGIETISAIIGRASDKEDDKITPLLTVEVQLGVYGVSMEEEATVVYAKEPDVRRVLKQQITQARADYLNKVSELKEKAAELIAQLRKEHEAKTGKKTGKKRRG